MFKRFISYYRPHKVLFTLDMFASFLVAVIGLVYPIITRQMLNDLIPNRKYREILVFGAVIFGCYVIRMLLRFFIQYQGHVMGVKMQAQMRREMFSHLEKLPYTFFDNHETGKIMSRMTSDLFEVTELAHHGPENILISTFSVLASFIYLLTINRLLTLFVFVFLPVMLLIVFVMRKKMNRAFMKTRVATATINAALESSVSGIRVTKAYTNAERELEKFEEGNAEFVNASKESYKAMGEFHASTTFVTDLFNVVVLIGGGLFLYAGKISFGDYSAFVVSTSLFLTPLTSLINFMEILEKGVTGFQRFIEVLEVEPETDAADAGDAGILNGEITFDHVSCAYQEEREVLRDVSFTIPVGCKFALVGPSGGGKTTICHLIPHFYEIQEGEIRIDKTELRKLTRESLRRNIGIVQQDVYLFNASIRDNIRYGRLDATEEEIIEAAKRANIHEFVLAMEDGYDTVIGERGVRLSGGQKQRLSIARVFLKNPPILILDEATSALDNTTEIQIQKSLDELCKGRTTIVVAHRLSTIRNADKIAVIAEGKIREMGNHEELIEKDGMYKKLYMEQFRDS